MSNLFNHPTISADGADSSIELQHSKGNIIFAGTQFSCEYNFITVDQAFCDRV